MAGSAGPTDETLIAGGKLYLNDAWDVMANPGSLVILAALFTRERLNFSRSERNTQTQRFLGSEHGIRRTGMAPQYFYSDEKLWLLAAFIKRVSNLSPSVSEGVQNSALVSATYEKKSVS